MAFFNSNGSLNLRAVVLQFLRAASTERNRALWADTVEQYEEAIDAAKFYLARAREANEAARG